jgi:putative ABC transport system permease protein
MSTIYFELRHSLQRLYRSPAFTCVFIITIGLAIGATTTTVSVLETIVLRPVSAPEPNRLVSISVTDARTNQLGYIYPDTFAAYRDVQQSLSKMSMYSARYFRVEARGATADGLAEGVAPAYFDALGARAALGRFFTDLDTTAVPVMVLSDRFRRRLFGEMAEVVGEVVKVEGKPVTIIGVAAPGFEGLQFDGGADIFVPLAVMQTVAGGSTGTLRSRNIIGQLAPSVALAGLRTELLARWPATQQETVPSSLSAVEQQALRSQKIEVEPVGGGISTLRLRYGSSVNVLVGLSAVLLAIACVNLTGLLLARALGQRHQIAVRLAMGASRRRAVCQILLDGVLLALGGFVLSVPVTLWATRELSTLFAFGRTTPLIHSMTPGGSVLGVAALITVLIGVAIGILPAWRTASTETAAVLHSKRAIAGTLGRSGRLLLVVQVALSVILLVGAGLFINTLSELRTNYDSVQARNVVFTRLALEPGDRSPIDSTYWQTLLGALAGVPGVRSAALSVYFPTYFQFPDPVPTDRYLRAAVDPPAEISALTEFVSPGFFDTFGISRLQGRDFTWADNGTTAPVVMVSQSVATTLFSGGDAVGRRLQMSSGKAVREFEIVGVVADAPFGTIREPHQATVFRPILQEPSKAVSPMAHVRFQGDLKSVGDGYTRAVASQGRHFVRVLFTFNDFTNSVLLKERMTAWLAAFVSVLIVALACIGVFSMLAYGVTSRIREIGIRSALGATRGTIVRMIVREGLSVAIPGVAIGVAGALAAAGLVRSQLYGIAPHDPSTVVGAIVALILTVAVASLVPALRAAKIEPMEALRQD